MYSPVDTDYNTVLYCIGYLTHDFNSPNLNMIMKPFDFLLRISRTLSALLFSSSPKPHMAMALSLYVMINCRVDQPFPFLKL